MRRREEIAAARLSDALLKRLLQRKLIEVKDESRVRALFQKVIGENLQAEEELNVAARQLLQSYARDIREKGLDYRQLFSRAKEKLARERGFVL